MTHLGKIALLGFGVAALAGGCAAHSYDDDGYYRRGRADSYYRDHGDRAYWGDRNNEDRVRVCDADGDDCHWEYRRR